MSRTYHWALGLALALATTGMASAASAQTFKAPKERSAASLDQTSSAMHASADGPDLLVTHDLDGYRACRQGDNGCRWTSYDDYETYRTRHPGAGMAPASDVAQENANVCRMTGDWIRRSLVIKAKIAEVRGYVTDVDEDLVKLGRAENHVSWLRRGLEVAATGAFCAIPHVGWAYCLGAGLNELGGEANGTAHDKANRVDLKQRKFTNEVMSIDLETRDLDIDQRIGWAVMVHSYCLQIYPDQTTGS